MFAEGSGDVGQSLAEISFAWDPFERFLFWVLSKDFVYYRYRGVEVLYQWGEEYFLIHRLIACYIEIRYLR